MDSLTIRDLLKIPALTTDQTQIVVRDSGGRDVAAGPWFQDNILELQEREVEAFSYWVPPGRMCIVLKEKDGRKP